MSEVRSFDMLVRSCLLAGGRQTCEGAQGSAWALVAGAMLPSGWRICLCVFRRYSISYRCGSAGGGMALSWFLEGERERERELASVSIVGRHVASRRVRHRRGRFTAHVRKGHVACSSVRQAWISTACFLCLCDSVALGSVQGCLQAQERGRRQPLPQDLAKTKSEYMRSSLPNFGVPVHVGSRLHLPLVTIHVKWGAVPHKSSCCGEVCRRIGTIAPGSV